MPINVLDCRFAYKFVPEKSQVQLSTLLTEETRLLLSVKSTPLHVNVEFEVGVGVQGRALEVVHNEVGRIEVTRTRGYSSAAASLEPSLFRQVLIAGVLSICKAFAIGGGRGIALKFEDVGGFESRIVHNNRIFKGFGGGLLWGVKVNSFIRLHLTR